MPVTPPAEPRGPREDALDAAARHTDMVLKDLQKMGADGRPLLRDAMHLRQQILDRQLGQTTEPA